MLLICHVDMRYPALHQKGITYQAGSPQVKIESLLVASSTNFAMRHEEMRLKVGETWPELKMQLATQLVANGYSLFPASLINSRPCALTAELEALSWRVQAEKEKIFQPSL